MEARRESLLDQLDVKFGAVDATIRQHVESAGDEQLIGWLRRVVVATTVDAVFTG